MISGQDQNSEDLIYDGDTTIHSTVQEDSSQSVIPCSQPENRVTVEVEDGDGISFRKCHESSANKCNVSLPHEENVEPQIQSSIRLSNVSEFDRLDVSIPDIPNDLIAEVNLWPIDRRQFRFKPIDSSSAVKIRARIISNGHRLGTKFLLTLDDQQCFTATDFGKFGRIYRCRDRKNCNARLVLTLQW